MNFNEKLPDDEINVTKESDIGNLTWMLGGLSAFVIVAYFIFGYAVEYGVKHISVEKEQEIFAFLHVDKVFEDDMQDANETSEINQRLQALVDASKECSGTKYDFIVSVDETEEMNAFAAPGGYIVVTQGLIDKAESENELFFVLAHEIGHFNNRDHLEGIGRGFVAMALSAVIGLGDTSDLLQTSLDYSQSHFSQETESDADLFAVDLMQCYYGHTNGATDFFEHLPDTGYRLFSSHPETLERIYTIEDYIAQEQYFSKDKKQI